METKLQQDNSFIAAPLIDTGINLSAVFNLSDLPHALYTQVEAAAKKLPNSKQVMLFAHAGNRLWRKLQSSDFGFASVHNSARPIDNTRHPIDGYSIEKVTEHLKQYYPSLNFQILYPSAQDFNQPIGLQQFGELAGWHHNSPLKVGINQTWGTWFAYRVLLVCDGQFKPTEKLQSKSPCVSCSDKPCISECPAKALSQTAFDLNRCSQYRASEQSQCRDRCVARLACPVSIEHRYPIEQIQYHYGRTMQIIQQMFD
jgi:epoxyqueuosine reductase